MCDSLYNHHHNPVLEYFHHPPRDSSFWFVVSPQATADLLPCLCGFTFPGHFIQLESYRGFPGSPVAETLHSQCKGAEVQSLVRELDPMCHS